VLIGQFVLRLRQSAPIRSYYVKLGYAWFWRSFLGVMGPNTKQAARKVGGLNLFACAAFLVFGIGRHESVTKTGIWGGCGENSKKTEKPAATAFRPERNALQGRWIFAVRGKTC